MKNGKAKSKKTLQEKIGVKNVGVVLTAKSCRDRAIHIRKMVDRNEVKGDARLNLLKQAAWYMWRSKQFTGGRKKAKATKKR